MAQIQKFSAAPLELYQSGLRNICGRFDAVARGDSGQVNGGIALYRRGRIDIAEFSNDLKQVRRDDASAKRDGGAHLFLVRQNLGQTVMMQGERAIRSRPGDFVLIDSVCASQFIHGGARSSQTSVHLPREEWVCRFPKSRLAGLHIEGGRDLVRTLDAVLNRLIASDCDEAVQAALTDAMCGILSAVLLEAPGETSGDVDHDPDARLFATIERYFRDSSCTASDIALKMNVPLQQLQRRLRAAGQTLSELLIERRLRYACEQLRADGLGLERHISDIAYEAGFNDISYFNRAFRDHFGMAPRDYREGGK